MQSLYSFFNNIVSKECKENPYRGGFSNNNLLTSDTREEIMQSLYSFFNNIVSKEYKENPYRGGFSNNNLLTSWRGCLMMLCQKPHIIWSILDRIVRLIFIP